MLRRSRRLLWLVLHICGHGYACLLSVPLSPLFFHILNPAGLIHILSKINSLVEGIV